jgi:hypothetical protein
MASVEGIHINDLRDEFWLAESISAYRRWYRCYILLDTSFWPVRGGLGGGCEQDLEVASSR